MSVFTYVVAVSPFGVPVKTIADGFILDYILNCSPGAVGVMELTCNPAIDINVFLPDTKFGVYRSIDGAPPYLDNNAFFFLEHVKYDVNTTYIRAVHANTLATRRIVAYPAGTPYTSKGPAPADDLLKAFWRENAGSLIGGTRDGTQTLADLSAYVQVSADSSQGPTISMSGTRDPLDAVLQRVCDASATAGTYLTYEIVALSDSMFEFRTFVTIRGVDHGSTSSSPLVLAENRANLGKASITYDYRQEITVAIAGGQGTNSDRLIATSLDVPRMSVSPFHRLERFIDRSNDGITASLQDGADAALRDGRPSIALGGTLIDTAKTTRGRDYDLGDILIVEAPRSGIQMDVRLDLIHEHIDATGSSSGQELTGHQVQHRYALGGLRSI